MSQQPWDIELPLQPSARSQRLGPQQGESTFRWATVTDNSPLVIRFDGDSDPLPMAPDTLVDPTTLVVGDRVWTHLFARRVIVLGKAH